MDQQKKKRGENWSSEQKEILRQLISQSRHIIEDKSTKTSANLLKAKEWKNISNRFIELTGKHRCDGELKLAWKRMKLSAKSNLSAHKREQTKTGGGPKPPSPTPEEIQIMEIAPYDFIVETNDYDSDAVIPVIAKKETLADPMPGPSSDPNTLIVAQKLPENNAVEAPTNNEIREKTKWQSKKKQKSLQTRSEDARQTIVQSNIHFKERQLQMMEEEHKYNIKIANLKIKKLELEIALLERQNNILPTEK